MSDIDLFRDFNTRYGHLTGDWVLQNSAALMQDCLRQTDTMARYGGEEFVILLPITDAQAAASLAERLRACVADQAWDSPSGTLHITISVGVATLPSARISTSEQLLACADQALYQAKANGRNRVEVFKET